MKQVCDVLKQWILENFRNSSSKYYAQVSKRIKHSVKILKVLTRTGNDDNEEVYLKKPVMFYVPAEQQKITTIH